MRRRSDLMTPRRKGAALRSQLQCQQTQGQPGTVVVRM